VRKGDRWSLSGEGEKLALKNFLSHLAVFGLTGKKEIHGFGSGGMRTKG
jgi:hypothetical protein